VQSTLIQVRIPASPSNPSSTTISGSSDTFLPAVGCDSTCDGHTLYNTAARYLPYMDPVHDDLTVTFSSTAVNTTDRKSVDRCNVIRVMTVF
jgi:hypothetical protein